MNAELPQFESGEEALAHFENSEDFRVSDFAGGPMLTHELKDGRWIEHGTDGQPIDKTELKIKNNAADLQEHLKIINDLESKSFSIIVKNSSEINSGSEVAKADYGQKICAIVYTKNSGGQIEFHDFEGTKKEFEDKFAREGWLQELLDSSDYDDNDDIKKPSEQQAPLKLDAILGLGEKNEKEAVSQKSAWQDFWDNLLKPKAETQNEIQPPQINLLDFFTSGNIAEAVDTNQKFQPETKTSSFLDSWLPSLAPRLAAETGNSGIRIALHTEVEPIFSETKAIQEPGPTLNSEETYSGISIEPIILRNEKVSPTLISKTEEVDKPNFIPTQAKEEMTIEKPAEPDLDNIQKPGIQETSPVTQLESITDIEEDITIQNHVIEQVQPGQQITQKEGDTRVEAREISEDSIQADSITQELAVVMEKPDTTSAETTIKDAAEKNALPAKLVEKPSEAANIDTAKDIHHTDAPVVKEAIKETNGETHQLEETEKAGAANLSQTDRIEIPKVGQPREIPIQNLEREIQALSKVITKAEAKKETAAKPVAKAIQSPSIIRQEIKTNAHEKAPIQNEPAQIPAIIDALAKLNAPKSRSVPIHGRPSSPINPPRLAPASSSLGGPSETGRHATPAENFRAAKPIYDSAKRHAGILTRTTQATASKKANRSQAAEIISLFNNKSSAVKTQQSQNNDALIENQPQAIRIAA